MSKEQTAFRIVGGPRDGFWFGSEAEMRKVTDKLQPISQPSLLPTRVYRGIPFRVADEATWTLLLCGLGVMTTRWRKGEDAAALNREYLDPYYEPYSSMHEGAS